MYIWCAIIQIVTTATFSTLAIVFPALFSKDIYWVVRSHLIFFVIFYYITIIIITTTACPGVP